MSWKKKISILLLIALLSLLSATGLLITSTGLHLLIKIADWWIPGLTISTISGNWLDLRLQGIHYQISDTGNTPTVTVDVEQLHFSLQPSCLKSRQLCINNIQLQDVNIMVNTRAMSSETTDTPFVISKWHTPLPATLKQLTVRNLKVMVNDTAISLEELDTAATWQGYKLTIMPAKINLLSIAIPESRTAVLAETAIRVPASSHSITPAIDKTLAEKINVFFNKPLLPDLPDITLPLDIQITKIYGQQLQLTGSSNFLINSLLLQANTQNTKIRVDTFIINSPQGSFSAQGEATMADRWPVNLLVKGTLNTEPLKKQEITLNISGKLQDQTRLALHLSGPIDAQLNAVTSLRETGLPLSLTLQSKQLHWPLADSPQYHVSDFKMDLKGKVIDYNLSIRSNLGAFNMPPVAITLDGQGNTRRFNLTLLRLAALKGHADVSGSLDWHDRISWNAILTLAGINTYPQWPAWPGKIDGKIITSGTHEDKNWQIEIKELFLKGHVKKHQFSAKGALTGNSAGRWQIPAFSLMVGPNTLDVKGSIGDKWSLDSSLNAPDLNGIFSGLGGLAKGTLKLGGSLTTPQVSIQFMASHLQWQKLFINHINIAGTIKSTQQVQGQFTLQLKQLKQDQLKIDSLNLDAHGNEHQHTVAIKLAGYPLAGQLTLAGNFNRRQQRYHGTLDNTWFVTPVGKWQPDHAISMDYINTERKIIIQPHCWQNTKAELCIPKPIETGHDSRASVVLSHFDLALIQPYIPAITMNGTLNGQADMHWQKGAKLPQAHIFLSGQKIKITQKKQNTSQQLTFDSVNFYSELNHGKVQFNWLIKPENSGQLNGQIKLDILQKQRNISGNITINNFSLAAFNALLMHDEKINGMLNADLQLGGNTQKPLIFGRMEWDRLNISENSLPLNITESRILMEFHGMKSTLYGSIHTPDGQLMLAGDASWHDINKLRARMTAKGKGLRINIPPMIRMDVSPDLLIEATTQTLSLNGSVHIPWARISVHDLPKDVVAVSTDEIILNDNLEPAVPKTSAISVNSNLVIQLGNDVQLNALGLHAKLHGNIKMVQGTHGLGLNGQIDIASGRFRAWGQDLIVRKGSLLFSGLPDRPFLNIEAIRNPEVTADNVTAGVRVTGMADKAKTELFSDPVLSQQETLSYLLHGRGLNHEAGENSMMFSMLMLTGRSIADSTNLVNKVGETFGINSLQLETEGTGMDSRVAVSGQVNRDLQLKYSRGIFDSLVKLTLRYRLMQGLYVEGVSGLSQGVDLLYQFEVK